MSSSGSTIASMPRAASASASAAASARRRVTRRERGYRYGGRRFRLALPPNALHKRGGPPRPASIEGDHLRNLRGQLVANGHDGRLVIAGRDDDRHRRQAAAPADARQRDIDAGFAAADFDRDATDVLQTLLARRAIGEFHAAG